MNLRGTLSEKMPQGYDVPGVAGVCPACGHTPTKHYRLTWFDKLMRAAKSSRHCTALEDGQGPAGHPPTCMCHDPYHLRHFL